jgi:hypothetical protein
MTRNNIQFFHMCAVIVFIRLTFLVIKEKRVWVTQHMPLGLLRNTNINTMKWYEMRCFELYVTLPLARE